MDPNVYLALVTIHGTIMVFFVLTAGLSGTFSNLLIPLQIGARDMASGLLNMISFWLFFLFLFSSFPFLEYLQGASASRAIIRGVRHPFPFVIATAGRLPTGAKEEVRQETPRRPSLALR